MRIKLHFVRMFTICIAMILLVGSLPVSPAQAISSMQPVPDVPGLLANTNVNWLAEVQESIQQSEYQITWQDQTALADLPSAYQAPNRTHNLRAYFTPKGLRLTPRQFREQVPPWEWGLALRGYGYDGRPEPLEVPDPLLVNGNHVEYRYPTSSIVEWYANSEQGLEHGFKLYSPPHFESEKNTGKIVLELTMSGSLVPQLTEDGQTLEFITPGGVNVLRSSNLLVKDAAGRRLSAQLYHSLEGELAQNGRLGQNTSEQRIGLHIPIANAVFPLDVQFLLTAPNWSAESDQVNSYYGYSVSTAGDVNGDGYTDVLVGARYYDNGEADEGRTFLYQGGASGPSSSPAWAAESDQVDANFGASVNTAGDINGDGYADVIIGAFAYDGGQTDEGRAYVYLGSPSGLSTNPSWTAESDQAGALFGDSVSAAGDVNGDSYGDVIIGAFRYNNPQTNEGRAYIYLGGPDGLSNSPTWIAESDQAEAYYGIAVSTAGDVNGDGYADVIVGALYYDNGQINEGRAYVYYGSVDGPGIAPDWTAESDQAGAYLGASVNTAGDVNGDGYADVIVGAYLFDNGQANEGRVWVYLGGPSGLGVSPSWTAESDQAEANFGISAGTAGDVNGDGYADVVVGAPYYDNGQTNEGRAYIFYGSANGLGASPDWTAESDQAAAGFGIAVAIAGDVNGDGYADVIVGAPGYNNDQIDEGRAYVYLGKPDAVSVSPSWTAEGDQNGAYFGWRLNSAGDVNGDGFADVIVGAYRYDDGLSDNGRAYVFLGGPGGLETTPSWIAHSNQATSGFGVAVSTAGDVNGDGYDEVIIGAYRYNNYKGKAYVYYGSANGLSTDPNWVTEGNSTNTYWGGSVNTAGDVNGDGYDDVVVGAYGYNGNRGRVYVYHGSAEGLSVDPVWFVEGGQNAHFGETVGPAGDVNGDGYDDLIMGTDNINRVFVYYGSRNGLIYPPAWFAAGSQSGSMFGWYPSTAGDVNGDGYADVIVGAYRYDNGQTDEGRVFAYYGSAEGLSVEPSWWAESNEIGALFGSSLNTAGDVNGDGYADVIVGAMFYSYGFGQTEEGGAYIYNGGPAGLSVNPSWKVESNQNNADMGISVSTAGDVNGDGYADVIVGAYLYDGGSTDEGRAYMYYGNHDGLELIPRPRRSDDSAPIAMGGQSDAYTSFRLAALGRTPFGRNRVKLEWEVKPLGEPFDGTITGESANWLDTGIAGIALNELVSGLSHHTAYHWRLRLHYHPASTPLQQYSRWFTMPWNGWNQTDLRTPNALPMANNDILTIDEDNLLITTTPGVLENDSDAGGDLLTAILDSSPLYGALNLAPDGSLVYTPTLNFTGVVTFTYHVSDGVVDSNIALATINVNPINDSPVLDPIGDYTVNEMTSLEFTVTASDVDSPSDVLTFGLDPGAPSGANIDPNTGLFTWTPTGAQGPGIYGITILVTDNGFPALDDSETITITVYNLAPVALANDYTAVAGTTLSIEAPGVLDNDSDPGGDAISAILDSGPIHGVLTLNLDGSFVYIPDAGFVGTDNFTYYVSDGVGNSTVVTVVIFVILKIYFPLMFMRSYP